MIISTNEMISSIKAGFVVLSAVIVYLPVAGFIHGFGVFVDVFDEDLCPEHDCLRLLGFISATSFASFRLLSWLCALLCSRIHPSWVFIIGIILCVASLITTSYVDDITHLLITHSLLFGFGSNFMLNTPIIIIDRLYPHRHKRHVLTTSIVNLGPAIGAIIMNPLAVYLDELPNRSWRDTLRLLAAAIGVSGMFYLAVLHQSCCTDQRDVYEDLDAELSARDGDDRKCKRKTLEPSEGPCDWFIGAGQTAVWLIGLFTVSFAIFIPKAMFIDYLTSIDIPVENAAMLMSFSALSEALFTFLISGIGDYLEYHLTAIYFGGAFTLALFNLFMPLITSEPALGIYCLIHGAVDGLLMTPLFSVSGRVAYRDRFRPFVWHCTNAVVGLGQLSGLPMAGYLYDQSGSFTKVFLMCSAAFVVSCVMHILTFTSLLSREDDEEERCKFAEDQSSFEFDTTSYHGAWLPGSISDGEFVNKDIRESIRSKKKVKDVAKESETRETIPIEKEKDINISIPVEINSEHIKNSTVDGEIGNNITPPAVKDKETIKSPAVNNEDKNIKDTQIQESIGNDKNTPVDKDNEKDATTPQVLDDPVSCEKVDNIEQSNN